jgi:hypothetical protein
MNAKTVLSLLLIAFVAISVIFLVVKETGTTSESDTEILTDDPSQPRQVVAYYFHGFKRCKTCLHIESEAKKAIEGAFPDELKSGGLDWKAVNYEEETNSEMATKYELVAASLVIVDFENGQPTRWKTLEKVWELVWDEEPFAAYVISEVEGFMNSDGDDG